MSHGCHKVANWWPSSHMWLTDVGFITRVFLAPALFFLNQISRYHIEIRISLINSNNTVVSVFFFKKAIGSPDNLALNFHGPVLYWDRVAADPFKQEIGYATVPTFTTHVLPLPAW